MALATTAAVTTIVGTGYGMYQSHKAGKRANRAMKNQGSAMDAQVQMGREHMEWSKGVYDEWRQEFAPILEELKAEALAAKDPDYAAITADTQHAFDSQRGQNQRALQRFGVNPGDGAFGANERRMGIGQATAEVNARQAARRGEADSRFGRLAQVMGIGSGLQQSAMGITAGAFGGMAGIHGQQAGMYGQQAGMYGNAAAGAAQAAFGTDWGSIISNAFRTSSQDAPEEPAPDGG